MQIYIDWKHLCKWESFVYLFTFFFLWNVCYKSIYVVQSNNEQTNKNEKKKLFITCIRWISASNSKEPFLFASRTTTMSWAIDFAFVFGKIVRFVELILRLFRLLLVVALFRSFGESEINVWTLNSLGICWNIAHFYIFSLPPIGLSV